MRKILSLYLMCSVAITASATSQVLSSITSESYGSKYVTTFEYDSDNRLAKVISDESVYTFDYSKLATKKFIMTRTDTYGGRVETIVTEMTLNDEGLVVKAIEIEDGEVDDDYFTFDYTDGYLTSYRQVSPDEVEESKITYTDGVITKVENIDGESVTENETCSFEYDGILNAGGLLLFDSLFDVDLDDFDYVGMTGMLGKAPAELPLKTTRTDLYGTESDIFAWTLDESGYPSKLKISYEWGSESYEFLWSQPSGIAIIEGDGNGESTFYTIDGLPATPTAKGILIMHRPDGSTIKVIRR